jgi:hypothetical protein
MLGEMRASDVSGRKSENALAFMPGRFLLMASLPRGQGLAYATSSLRPLVQATQQPDHKNDWQGNADQPKQKSASHRSLLNLVLALPITEECGGWFPARGSGCPRRLAA